MEIVESLLGSTRINTPTTFNKHYLQELTEVKANKRKRCVNFYAILSKEHGRRASGCAKLVNTTFIQCQTFYCVNFFNKSHKICKI